LNEEELSRFSHLLQALKFGAPPHGGLAIGFDRLVSILCGAKSIKEVVAFPKSTAGYDPVFRSPSSADNEVLRGYGLASAVRKVEGKV
jgi:aspartyl-tRNA synthetase